MARYALVIGIGQNRSPLPSLSKTVGDAGAIAHILRIHGNFEVQELTGSVSERALVQGFERFLQQAHQNEALIYYTGHGFPLAKSFGKTEAFLASSDCEIRLDGDRRVVRQSGGLSLSDVNGVLSQASLSSLVMLVDCCHSGYLLEEELLRQTFSSFSAKDFFLITSCRSFEQARARRSEAHSVFTQAVLDGLSQERADKAGGVTGDALFGSVATQLKGSGQEARRLGVGRSLPIVQYRLQAPPSPIDNSIEPYQGLNAFTPKTKQFFFGRDGEVVGLLRKLQESSFVPVIGPSGIGKSSIVRAGLVPRLLEQGWQILGPIKPGPDPLGELKRSFREVFPERRLAWVYEHIEAGNLGAVVAELPGASRFLLVIDQFEEVFTVCINPEKRQRFITQLVGTNRVRPPGVDSPHPPGVDSQPDSRLAIVTTMRSDFINNWLATGQPTQVMQNQTVMVGPRCRGWGCGMRSSSLLSCWAISLARGWLS